MKIKNKTKVVNNIPFYSSCISKVPSIVCSSSKLLQFLLYEENMLTIVKEYLYTNKVRIR